MADDILIVDDEADIRDLVAGILEDEGYSTRTAGNSDEALAAVKARRPSMAFLDIWLQGSRLDGLQLLDAIKEEHSAFYHRIFRSEQAVPPRNYPGLTVPVHLFQSKCSENMQATLDRFPFFNSTAFEQRMLFQRPNRGELAPLTILPTAKYFEAA